ncbi:type II toxin-antitoxin system toxin DNA ADP-ribosyl transferase DarT [Acanthopleuribacter pedis]|uniref:DUF4433 domain-containing protein n=1 Tax=Acanthopleuribacter pedis TaxID=442870 RepID=A0A8J7Q262_9BACT|nr:DUF4433 domain-containing protein [Acanthopleuribacter pedis]MBO1319132.1 DUF4433 domain-containing protein [Acanthopleuribacter pedis]
MRIENLKLYHIVHTDNLKSILSDGFLWSDALMQQRGIKATTIGFSNIKRRRLESNRLRCHPGLYVGECVPFYFCPRSVMLYLIHRGNNLELPYKGGQQHIIHLEARLIRVVRWANAHQKRWAFTFTNAGAFYFEDSNNLTDLERVDWRVVASWDWSDPLVKEAKQAEFLLEGAFPVGLIARIGVYSKLVRDQVLEIYSPRPCPTIRVIQNWYY